MSGCDDYTFDIPQEIEDAVNRYAQSDYVEKPMLYAAERSECLW